mgnify:CR=1 FL=1
MQSGSCGLGLLVWGSFFCVACPVCDLQKKGVAAVICVVFVVYVINSLSERGTIKSTAILSKDGAKVVCSGIMVRVCAGISGDLL